MNKLIYPDWPKVHKFLEEIKAICVDIRDAVSVEESEEEPDFDAEDSEEEAEEVIEEEPRARKLPGGDSARLTRTQSTLSLSGVSKSKPQEQQPNTLSTSEVTVPMTPSRQSEGVNRSGGISTRFSIKGTNASGRKCLLESSTEVPPQ